MHMSAKLVRRSCPIDVLRHVFKKRRVENDRSHSTGMTRSLGLHGFPSSTYTHSKIKHTKMKGHAYKIWGAIARSIASPCHATPLLYCPLPIHLTNHWALVVCDMEKETLQYYDSLSSCNSNYSCLAIN